MKSFWKDNSKTIKRLWLYQFATVFMGIPLGLVAFNVHKSSYILAVALSCVPVLFYLYLVFALMWEKGADDIIKVEGGRAKKNRLKGLQISLFANVPNFIIFIFVFIGFCFGHDNGIFHWQWAKVVYLIAKGFGVIFESMYNGIVSLFSPYNPIIYLLMIVPALLVSLLGYNFGLKNAPLFGIKGRPAKKDKTDRSDIK